MLRLFPLSSRAVLGAVLTFILAGCGESDPQQQGAAPAVNVGYVTVQPTSAPLNVELAGRVTAFQVSQVRPQVNGIIRKRFFKEGSMVQQGQTLYQIDPSLYRAAVNEAQANVNSAQATATASRIRAQRLRPLAEMEAVAEQDYTDAQATERQARAAVQQSSAQLESARINLRFTNVPAPITGHIGRSLFTEGALVTSNQADPLAVIQRVDPVYVDIQQSSADLLALRRAQAKGGLAPASAEVRLKLEDGSDYGSVGRVEFSEVMVDEGTGTVTLRARFPNPQGILLPGMFVRAVFAQAVETKAFLVPQAGVTHDAKGAATLWVVASGDKAELRTVTAERTAGANWVVTSGLKSGDRVIVQGSGNLRPNASVKPVPADTPQKIETPTSQPGDAAGAKGG